MPEVRVELWRDELGVERELVLLGLDEIAGSCLVRERNLLDEIDGDGSEGFMVVARFGDAEDAREFLREEGFEPVG